MTGRIYISGAFTTVSRTRCGGGPGWLHNDPHFWSNPPTWGICRTDLRRVVRPGDYVFFVLPKYSALGPEHQMLYGCLFVKEKITHDESYKRPELRGKRMRPPKRGSPNGNIIVKSDGGHNPLDGNEDHKRRFRSIKKHYVVGGPRKTEFVEASRIRSLAPSFVPTLGRIFGEDGQSPFGILTRWGRKLKDDQVNELLEWLKGGG